MEDNELTGWIYIGNRHSKSKGIIHQFEEIKKISNYIEQFTDEDLKDNERLTGVMMALKLSYDDAYMPSLSIKIVDLDGNDESEELLIAFHDDEWDKFVAIINTMDKFKKINEIQKR